jgi:hypothetical protein
VGWVYRIRTLLYSSTDPAAERPVVVLAVPALLTARIQVVTRTKNLTSGVPHAANRALGLDLDGAFCNLVSIERTLWCPENVGIYGPLEETCWQAVLDRFS